MDVTKPYKFIGFWAMDVTKPYRFIGFGAMECFIEKYVFVISRSVFVGQVFLGRPGAPRPKNHTISRNE